jgi:hypothetical protein
MISMSAAESAMLLSANCYWTVVDVSESEVDGKAHSLPTPDLFTISVVFLLKV